MSVEKEGTIPRTDFSNKSTRIEKPSEIHIQEDNLSVSIFYGQGKSLSSVTPDYICITLKNKNKKTPDTLIIRK